MASQNKDFKVKNGIVAGSKIQTAASTTTIASLNIPHGSAPTLPVNGDVWTTTDGLYARINGTTIGPFGTGGGSSVTVSDAHPTTATQGNLWYESDTGKTFIYYDSYWVEIGSQQSSPTVQLTGDITGIGSENIATNLAISGVTSGTYGSSSAIPIITVDSKGRVTNASTTALTSIVSSLSFGSIGLTPATGTTGDITVAGTLATTNGGTGLTSFTANKAVYSTSTSALTTGTLPIAAGGTNSTSTPTAGAVAFGNGTSFGFTAAGTSGQFLQSTGSGTPIWAAVISSAYQATAPTSPATGALWVDSDLDVLYVYTGATNSWVSPMGIQMSTPTFSTNNYNAVLSDRSKMLLLTNGATAGTITLSSGVAFPIGTQIQIVQTGTGQISVVGSGVTVNATPGLKLRAQYSSATLIKTASTTWLAVGDLSV